MKLDAGSLGSFVRRDDGAAVKDLQPSWMNKLGCEESLGVNIHMGYEGDTNTQHHCITSVFCLGYLI